MILEFHEGDRVWLYNPQNGVSPKLTPSTEGPYAVTKRINYLAYRIKRNSKSKMKVIHLADNVPWWWQIGSGQSELEKGWCYENPKRLFKVWKRTKALEIFVIFLDKSRYILKHSRVFNEATFRCLFCMVKYIT